MPNVSPSNPRTPGRVPRRGLAALVLTATAVAMLFSFKTPSDMFASGPGGAFVAGVAPMTATALETTITSDAGATADTGTSVPLGPPAPTMSPATEPPATIAPPTEAPPTEIPPTDPPATEPPAVVMAQQVLTGQTVRTPYGLIQVEVTLDGGSISDVKALQLPYDRSYSAQISRYVEPILRDEALQAQSASINLISGATYTSTGYAMSLQSALDQAV